MVRTLIRLGFSDPAAGVRQYEALGANRLNDPNYVEPFLTHLRNDTEPVRFACAQGVGFVRHRGEPIVWTRLAMAHRTETNPMVRQQLMRTLRVVRSSRWTCQSSATSDGCESTRACIFRNYALAGRHSRGCNCVARWLASRLSDHLLVERRVRADVRLGNRPWSELQRRTDDVFGASSARCPLTDFTSELVTLSKSARRSNAAAD